MPDDPDAEKFVQAADVAKVDGLYSGDRIGITVDSGPSLVFAIVVGIVGGFVYLAIAVIRPVIWILLRGLRGVRAIFRGAR